MTRALAASLIVLIGWAPALAADGPPHAPGWRSSAAAHELRGRPDLGHRWAPRLVWLGLSNDPLQAWDDGFFTDLKYGSDPHWLHRWRRHTPSGDVKVFNGEALYLYDRGYPYDHYDYGDHGSERNEPDDGESASVSCRTQWTWSDRDRRDVPVRICS